MKQIYSILSAIVLSATLSCRGESPKPKEIKPINNKFLNEVQTLEIVTKTAFEEVKTNPRLRADYVSKKAETAIRELEQTIGFSGFVNKIIYDPGFNQLDSYIENTIAELNNNPSTYKFRNVLLDTLRHRNGASRKIALTFSKECIGSGTSSNIYLSEIIFDANLMSSEEEFKSILDHELVHAVMNYKGLSFKGECASFLDSTETLEIVNLDGYLATVIQETLAFQIQYGYIQNGTRNVSERFKQCILKEYKRAYSELKTLSEENNSDQSKVAKALICSIPSPLQ